MLAEDRIYYLGRGGRMVIVAVAPRFEILAANTVEGGRGVFNAMPAFGGARPLLRSNRTLYAIAQ